MIVNNAGVMPLSLMASMKVDEWDRIVDVNIKGVLHGIAALLPEMIRASPPMATSLTAYCITPA